jgi:cytochrome c biogenesis protein CcmG, thiol:disulfide interchange protein DsbE
MDANCEGVLPTSGKIAYMGHGSVTLGQISRIALVLATLVLAGCGTAARNAAPSAAQISSDFKGSPAPLAAVHAQANKLLPGGAHAFKRELRALRGYPVVVNQWGSWCTNCQQEMAVFQQVSALDGRRVAFLGDDLHEGAGAGRSLLRRLPLSYPSFSDQSSAVADVLNKATASYAPITFFYNAKGKQVFFHDGPYQSIASLEHDIRFYLGV